MILSMYYLPSMILNLTTGLSHKHYLPKKRKIMFKLIIFKISLCKSDVYTQLKKFSLLEVLLKKIVLAKCLKINCFHLPYKAFYFLVDVDYFYILVFTLAHKIYLKKIFYSKIFYKAI